MADPIRFETHPSQYKHWKLDVDGAIAKLNMDVKEDQGLRPGYPLKLNSYDLGVDIELADAVQRIRFEHPRVKVIVIGSLKDRVFCSGANIYMLASSTHGFKVNFCKYTNETRLSLEQAASESGILSLCAINGPCAGGGYELALACNEIILQDDGSSAVSLPEVPLLGVLPGTGGLTRLVDKRKVRRDLADVFCTLAEGIRGNRAVQWGLVDRSVARSKFSDTVRDRANALAAQSKRLDFSAVELPKLDVKYTANSATYQYVTLTLDETQRTAEIVVKAPSNQNPPRDGKEAQALGASWWALAAFRELDNALLTLRFNYPSVGLLVIKTQGDSDSVVAHDRALANLSNTDGFAREVLLHMQRVLKRLDQTARSTFAVIDEGSCFTGSLYELCLAADRSYMKDDPDTKSPITVMLTELNFGMLPTGNGLSRLETRFLREPGKVKELPKHSQLDAQQAVSLGLVTFTPDVIDWDDEVRVAIEERASLSPDALTGMEASLRFAGPETLETKIFGRLSAWQNWIFIRPNATGKRGALTMYGQPERPEFDWNRT